MVIAISALMAAFIGGLFIGRLVGLRESSAKQTALTAIHALFAEHAHPSVQLEDLCQ